MATKTTEKSENKPPVERRGPKTMDKYNRRAFSLHYVVYFMTPPRPIIVSFWFEWQSFNSWVKKIPLLTGATHVKYYPR